jgi:GT2 family glycosyltransferase
MPIEIPVLVVCTNEARDLRGWVRSVDSLRTPSVTPVPCIADNACSDDTVGVIRDAIHAGLVDSENVLWLHSNLGFSAAQNQLIRRLCVAERYDLFATLNIDARADSNWLSRLVTDARKPPESCVAKVGMWGGLILQPQDQGDLISSAGHALRCDGACLDIDRKVKFTETRYSNTAGFEPFCPCFAAALWSIEMVRSAGLPDSGQFLYYDDFDLGFKARIRGWRAAFVGDALAYHPIPNSKATIDRQRQLQKRGRLLMVMRYLPDAIAKSVLSHLSDDEECIVADIDTREKRPFGDDEARRETYRSWAGKFVPSKKDN